MCRWPDEPLRSVLVRRLSQLGVARFAARYPALCQALLQSLLELTVKYYKTGERWLPKAEELVACGCLRVGSGCCMPFRWCAAQFQRVQLPFWEHSHCWHVSALLWVGRTSRHKGRGGTVTSPAAVLD